MTTREQLQQFVACVYEPGDWAEIRPLKGGNVEKYWSPAAELPDMAESIEARNLSGWNVYAGPNPRKDKGLSGDDNVLLCRCLFADFDHVQVNDGETSADVVLGKIEVVSFPLPTLVLNSGHGIHVYWRLAEPMKPRAWRTMQKRLIRLLGSDKAIHNPERIMRLPGFKNHKPPAADAFIIKADPTRVYPPAALESCLPDLDKADNEDAPPASTPVCEPIGGANRIERVRKYAETWEGVREGQRDTQAERHASCLTHDFALSEDEAWIILWEWNSKNDPPLSEKELRKCLQNGMKYGKHAIGEKLVMTPFRDTLRTGGDDGKEHRTPTIQYARTDAGCAERLADRHSHELRFCRGRGWLRYDGRRFTTEGAIDHARQYVIRDARALITEANRLDDDVKRSEIIKFALARESAAKVAATLTLAESMPHIIVTADALDADPYLLNCWNGTVDLRTGTLRPHNSVDLITRLSPVEFDAKATLPLWTAHLWRVLGENDALLEFLQTAMGYSCTGDTSEEVLFLVHGPAAGGKTTTIEAFKTALGEYAVTCDFETFLKRQAGGIRNDLARLAGARMVCSVEVDEGQTLAEGVVKQFTGGDKVSARFLHREFFEFKPQGKLWLVCNDAPKAKDTDDALWRRILRVPFERSIPKPERDPDVKRLLTNPEVGGPAVLAWIVAGCEKWRKTGLTVPSIVENATTELREAQDPLRDFFDDRCEFTDDAFVPVERLASSL